MDIGSPGGGRYCTRWSLQWFIVVGWVVLWSWCMILVDGFGCSEVCFDCLYWSALKNRNGRRGCLSLVLNRWVVRSGDDQPKGDDMRGDDGKVYFWFHWVPCVVGRRFVAALWFGAWMMISDVVFWCSNAEGYMWRNPIKSSGWGVVLLRARHCLLFVSRRLCRVRWAVHSGFDYDVKFQWSPILKGTTPSDTVR